MFLNSIDQIEQCSQIYIYGSGETGTSLLKYIINKRKDIIIKGFVDSFNSGTNEGKIILKIDDFLLLYKRETIIIASCYWPEISNSLNSYGIKEYFILSNNFLYDLSLLNVYGAFYFSQKEISKKIKEILSVTNLFLNPNDRLLYLALYGLRLNKSYDNEISLNFFKNFKIEALKDFTYLHLPSIKNAVDAGVYNGNETLNLANKLGVDSNILGFEPFKEFLKDNAAFINLLKREYVHVYPYALWNKEDNLYFSYSSNNQSGSTVNRKKKQLKNSFSCKAVCLDSFLKENFPHKIDLIRLDIEGSELEALYGAECTIKKDRPQIAVSIYHKKNHLYEIPLYLNSILDDYHYRIGHFTSTFIDTVFYAIPNESVHIKKIIK
jgi:FkbM family methyltransferase